MISTTQHPFLKGLKISAHLAMSACQSIPGAADAGPTGSLGVPLSLDSPAQGGKHIASNAGLKGCLGTRFMPFHSDPALS